MITSEQAEALDATTRDGDVLIVRDQDGECLAIWRDDEAARDWGAPPHERWFAAGLVDPAALEEYLQRAIEVYAVGRRIWPDMA